MQCWLLFGQCAKTMLHECFPCLFRIQCFYLTVEVGRAAFFFPPFFLKQALIPLPLSLQIQVHAAEIPAVHLRN